MGALALAVACSVAIAMIFKAAERRGMDRVALLAVNYAVALLGALALLGADPGGLTVSAGLVGLGVAQGALFIGGFVLFSLAIKTAGMALATGVMRLSVAVPFLASWLIWGEVPGTPQLAGLGLAFGAFVFIARRPSAPDANAAGVPAEPATDPAGEPAAGHITGWRVAALLLLLFLSGGVVDTLMKTFQEEFATGPGSMRFFLAMVFGVAWLLGTASVVATRVRTGAWPERAVWTWGLVLGLVNYGSAEFLLRALAVLPGPVVFPANSVGIVLFAALLGVGFWREKLTPANWVGLGLAAAALVLLSR